MSKEASNTEAQHVASNNSSLERGGAKSGGGIKQHFKRFWWVYLIALIIGILVVILPLIFVGFPHKAQKEINKATLEVTSQELSNPTPETFHLKQTVITTTNSKYHPELDEFEGALFLESTLPDIKPFGYITLPAVYAASQFETVIDQDVKIVDAEQFANYNKLALGSEEFRVAIRGKVGLKEGSLPKTKVDFNKVITMKGLNGLKGLEVTELHIKLKKEADGSNLVGTVSVPNPSVLTIQMGNVTLDLTVDGKPIGSSLLPNLTLKPGTHEYEMRGKSEQGAVLGLVTEKYKNGILPVKIVGKTVVADGKNLPYFEAAIQSNVVEVDLNVGPALKEAGLDITE